MTRPVLRTLLFVLFAACVKNNDITVRTSAIDDRSAADTGDDYDFQHVSVEGYVQQKPGFYPVHTADDWNAAWKETPDGKRPPMPANVDFKTKMLFVATSKTAAAATIEVQKVTRTFDGLHIYVLETLPAASCPAAPARAPAMDIISLDNVAFDMHVVYDRVHAETCGPPPDAVIACRVAGSAAPGAEKLTAAPGEMIDCDSSQSKPRIGPIKERTWQLHEPPPGSSSKLTIGKGKASASFPVDAWGTYELDLDVRDDTRAGSAAGIVDVLPPDAGVELFFTHVTNPNPAALPHVELHVMRLPLGQNGDCYGESQKPWCEVKTTPLLQQATLSPEANKRYRVVVKYLDARLPGAAVVCVRAFAKGVPAASTCEAEDAQRAKDATWELGALDIPHVSFYDARLAKAPAASGTGTVVGVPSATATAAVIIPPPVTPTVRPPTFLPPTAPTATATGSSQQTIEL